MSAWRAQQHTECHHCVDTAHPKVITMCSYGYSTCNLCGCGTTTSLVVDRTVAVRVQWCDECVQCVDINIDFRSLTEMNMLGKHHKRELLIFLNSKVETTTTTTTSSSSSSSSSSHFSFFFFLLLMLTISFRPLSFFPSRANLEALDQLVAWHTAVLVLVIRPKQIDKSDLEVRQKKGTIKGSKITKKFKYNNTKKTTTRTTTTNSTTSTNTITTTTNTSTPTLIEYVVFL